MRRRRWSWEAIRFWQALCAEWAAHCLTKDDALRITQPIDDALIGVFPHPAPSPTPPPLFQRRQRHRWRRVVGLPLSLPPPSSRGFSSNSPAPLRSQRRGSCLPASQPTLPPSLLGRRRLGRLHVLSLARGDVHHELGQDVRVAGPGRSFRHGASIARGLAGGGSPAGFKLRHYRRRPSFDTRRGRVLSSRPPAADR